MREWCRPIGLLGTPAGCPMSRACLDFNCLVCRTVRCGDLDLFLAVSSSPGPDRRAASCAVGLRCNGEWAVPRRNKPAKKKPRLAKGTGQVYQGLGTSLRHAMSVSKFLRWLSTSFR